MGAANSRAKYDEKRKEEGFSILGFSDVDLKVYEKEGESKRKWYLTRALTAKYFLDYGTDSYFVVALANQMEDSTYAFLWAATMIVSYLLLATDIAQAREIIASDAINSNFVNAEAYRYQVASSFTKFKLMKDISASTSKTDRRLFQAYFLMKEFPRTILVSVPQIVVLIINAVAINVPEVIVPVVIKGVLLAPSLIKLGLLLTIYPFIKCSAGGSVSEMARYRIDKRIDGVLKNHASEYKDMKTKGLKKALKEAGLKTGGEPQKLRQRLYEMETEQKGSTPMPLIEKDDEGNTAVDLPDEDLVDVVCPHCLKTVRVPQGIIGFQCGHCSTMLQAGVETPAMKTGHKLSKGISFVMAPIILVLDKILDLVIKEEKSK